MELLFWLTFKQIVFKLKLNHYFSEHVSKKGHKIPCTIQQILNYYVIQMTANIMIKYSGKRIKDMGLTLLILNVVASTNVKFVS